VEPATGLERSGPAGPATPSFPPSDLAIGSLRFLSFEPGPRGAASLKEELKLEILKVGHRRGVYRTRIDGAPAVVKVSFHRLGRFKLARERRLLLAMAARGLPAPRVIGGGRSRPGRFALAIEEVAEGLPFDAAWRDGSGPAVRRRLLRTLALSVAALHRSGVEHRDPHPRNFLLTPGGGVWVDAGSLRLGPAGRPLSPGRARRNLAAIRFGFGSAACATSREWLDALRSYLGPSMSRAERRAWAEAVLREESAIRGSALGRRLRRCLSTNRDFVQARRRGFRAAARREALGPSFELLFNDPDALFEGAAILKDGRSTRAARILWNGRPAFLKRYHRPGLVHRLKYLFRRQRGLRSWVTAYAAELRGLSTPRALAALEVRRAGWPVRSYLATEWIEGQTSAGLLASAGACDRPALAQALSRALARAHQSGLLHRDLKPQNVFFSPAERKAWLVDLDGARVHRRLQARAGERDLARWLRELPPDDSLHALLQDGYRRQLERDRGPFPTCLIR
jgi:tRNA A-37 threonylcarbamoyl transferase component Bud32